MGYESKVTLVKEWNFGNKDIHNSVIATIDMGKMGYSNGWRHLFRKKLVGTVYLNLTGDFKIVDGEIEEGPTKADPYGQSPTQAECKDVYKWLENHKSEDDTIEMIMLRDMLYKVLYCSPTAERYKLVHTGY